MYDHLFDLAESRLMQEAGGEAAWVANQEARLPLLRTHLELRDKVVLVTGGLLDAVVNNVGVTDRVDSSPNETSPVSNLAGGMLCDRQ